MDAVLRAANDEIANGRKTSEIELRAGRFTSQQYDAIIAKCGDTFGPPISREHEMTLSIVSASSPSRRGNRDDDASSSPLTSIAIRRAERGSNATAIKKTQLARFANGPTKIVVSREDNIGSDFANPSDSDIVRYRARLSWHIIIEGIPWVVDVTLVREKTYAEARTGASGTTSQSFADDVRAAKWAPGDVVEIEMELDMRRQIERDLVLDDFARAINTIEMIKPRTMIDRDRETGHDASTIVDATTNDDARVRGTILRALRDILKVRPAHLSLKTLLNNARGIDVVTYARNVFPTINGYFITDKADGERGIVIVDDADHCAMLTDTQFVGDQRCMAATDARIKFALDGEVMLARQHSIGDGESAPTEMTIFYAFDCMVIDGRSIINDPFERRITLIDATLVA